MLLFEQLFLEHVNLGPGRFALHILNYDISVRIPIPEVGLHLANPEIVLHMHFKLTDFSPRLLLLQFKVSVTFPDAIEPMPIEVALLGVVLLLTLGLADLADFARFPSAMLAMNRIHLEAAALLAFWAKECRAHLCSFASRLCLATLRRSW